MKSHAKHSTAKHVPAKKGHGKSTGGGTLKLIGGASPGVRGGVAAHHTKGMKGGHKAKTSH